jgi:hypothetical protein
VQNCEGVGGPRLASDGNQHAASSDKRLENPTVVRLKTDTAHRPGEA